MATGFQFYREEGYALVRGQSAPTTRKGRPARGDRAPAGRRSAQEVIGEAIRAEGDHPHVKAPQPPRVLHGLDADELAAYWPQIEDLAREQQVTMADGKKRRQRSDTPILIGAIVTHPGPADDNDPDYVRWRELAVAFLKRRHGDRILAIIEHRDEPHGHLHCLVADRGRSVKPLMAGHAAAAAALAEGKTKKEAAAAHKAALRALQDQFYAEVAIESGLTRQGPGRRSLTRAAWNAEQTQARNLAAAIRRKEEEAAELEARALELKAQAARNAAERAKLKEAAAAVVRAQRELEEQRAELARVMEAMSPAEVEQAARRADDLKRAEERRRGLALPGNEAAPPAPPAAKTGPRAR